MKVGACSRHRCTQHLLRCVRQAGSCRLGAGRPTSRTSRRWGSCSSTRLVPSTSGCTLRSWPLMAATDSLVGLAALLAVALELYQQLPSLAMALDQGESGGIWLHGLHHDDDLPWKQLGCLLGIIQLRMCLVFNRFCQQGMVAGCSRCVPAGRKLRDPIRASIPFPLAEALPR